MFLEVMFLASLEMTSFASVEVTSLASLEVTSPASLEVTSLGATLTDGSTTVKAPGIMTAAHPCCLAGRADS
jgi:hypothetical protein